MFPPTVTGIAKRALTVAVGATGLLLAGGCLNSESTDVIPANSVKVGVMLPFSGELSATGANAERSLLLATETINAMGGLNGRPMQLLVVDGHSSQERGAASVTEILRQQPTVLIGPELAALATLVSQEVAKTQTLQVLPGLLKPALSKPVGPQSRPSTIESSVSTQTMACSLAERIAKDGHQDVTIYAAGDEFHQTLARNTLRHFLSLKVAGEDLRRTGTIITASAADARATKFTVPLGMPYEAAVTSSIPSAEMFVAQSGATVIAAFAELAASWIWTGSAADTKRYLSPALSSDQFLQNLPKSTYPTLLGLAPALDTESGFAALYRQRWNEEPLIEAYLYWDAIMLTAFGVMNTPPGGTSLDLSARIIENSRPPGVLVKWNEFAIGSGEIAAGRDVNYHGLTSHMDITDAGALTAGTSLMRFWRVVGDARQSEFLAQCLQQ